MFEADNSKHCNTKRKRTEKKGNPKTTGESDDEIDKLEDRNKVPRIPVENTDQTRMNL